MDRLGWRRLVVASAIAAVAACGGDAPSVGPSVAPVASQLTAEASPSPEPVDTALPSVAPSVTPSEPAPSDEPFVCPYRTYDGPFASPLLPGSAVKVAVAELNIREGPCTGARKIRTLKKGDILIVGDGAYGPFKANGFPWYTVTRINVSGADGGLPPLPLSPIVYDGSPIIGGWIAAGDGTKPYVTQLAPRCPTTVDLETVRAMLPAELLACFQSPFELQGTFACECGGTGGPQATPPWLASGFAGHNLRTHWDPAEVPASIHFKPSGPPEPPAGSIIRVTVHVDDAAAQRCSFYWGLEEPPFTTPAQIAILYCRQQMVVDSYEILGTDPDW